MAKDVARTNLQGAKVQIISRASRDICMLVVMVGKKVANWVEVVVYTSPSIDRDAFVERAREKRCMLSEGTLSAWMDKRGKMAALWRWLARAEASGWVLYGPTSCWECPESLGAP